MKVTDLIGKTMVAVNQIGDDQIVFTTVGGQQYKLYHRQDCCESVTIESIVGDLADLVGEPIIIAEEATSRYNLEGLNIGNQESFTWTFYKFATRKGYVDIRWFGESNGYYSESVDFEEVKKKSRP